MVMALSVTSAFSKHSVYLTKIPAGPVPSPKLAGSLVFLSSKLHSRILSSSPYPVQNLSVSLKCSVTADNSEPFDSSADGHKQASSSLGGESLELPISDSEVANVVSNCEPGITSPSTEPPSTKNPSLKTSGIQHPSSENDGNSNPEQAISKQSYDPAGNQGQHPSVVEESGLDNQQLQSSLSALSQSLALLSATLNEVSAAVQLVARAVESRTSPAKAPRSVLESRLQGPARPDISSPPEPWDQPKSTNGQASANVVERSGRPDDHVMEQLADQNAKAHKLAYRVQQAFIQARIDGLGKPFEHGERRGVFIDLCGAYGHGFYPSMRVKLALEDFALTCIEAHEAGIGLKELQLQLILAEGALSGAFAVHSLRSTTDPFMREEGRIRSSWVRLVYTTLAEVEDMSRTTDQASILGENKEQPDPSDLFVKQVIKMAQEGLDLEQVRLEQIKSGPTTSGSVKAMRQCHYLILLTYGKALERRQS